jgi:hypothetical protein
MSVSKGSPGDLEKHRMAMADDLWSILPVQYRLLELPIVVLP